MWLNIVRYFHINYEYYFYNSPKNIYFTTFNQKGLLMLKLKPPPLKSYYTFTEQLSLLHALLKESSLHALLHINKQFHTLVPFDKKICMAQTDLWKQGRRQRRRKTHKPVQHTNSTKCNIYNTMKHINNTDVTHIQNI